jgi:ribonuclease P protein component
MPRRSLSFPKSRRLRRASEFEHVRQEGSAHKGGTLMLGVLVGKGSHVFRAGFITSRRIGSAVVRNRVRRRLREIVRHHQHEIMPGAWIVTIARVKAARATYRQLEDEWLRLAKRASILAA